MTSRSSFSGTIQNRSFWYCNRSWLQWLTLRKFITWLRSFLFWEDTLKSCRCCSNMKKLTIS